MSVLRPIILNIQFDQWQVKELKKSVPPTPLLSDGPAPRYAAADVRLKFNFRFINSKNRQIFNQASTAHLVERLALDLMVPGSIPGAGNFFN